MRLDKEQSGKRWSEIRDLWNAWDPIGVRPGSEGPEDEYDNYLGPSLRLLERGASSDEITEYLAHIVGEYMGMGENGIKHSDPHSFAATLQAWFSSKWAGTHV
jgi:hypothetical protein